MTLSYSLLPWPVWLSRLEYLPVNKNVVGLIPGQGTGLGCGSPIGALMRGNWSMFLSFALSLSPSLLLPLKSISMSLGEDKKNFN